MKVKKEKSISVVLAVFLGILTWIYTYKYDAWKFWVSLILIFVTFGLGAFIAWPWAVIDACIKPKEMFEDY